MTEKLNIKQLKPISTDVNLGTSNTLLPTQNAVKTYVDTADSGLQTQIDALSGRGRFLALWNCATGLAESNPPESPYLYKAGDYFVVGTVSSATPAVNYKPDGSSYTTGVASTTVETNEVSVNDTYFYDGTVWKLQSNAQKEVSFSALAGSPYDNTNLSNALNAKQDKLTAGTNITIDANNVISSTAQESFYRGRFSTWNSVPVNESGYLPEPGTQDLKTPTNNDFIVIIDPSDYVSPEFTENFTFRAFNDPELGYGVSWTYLNVTYTVYGNTVVFGPGDCLQLQVPIGGLTAFRTTIVDDTPLYPNSIRWINANTHTASATGSPGDYTGTWRFYYNGNWATDGKLGWFPQYQIENTLPIADDQTLGIAKLYTTTGSNTDGAVDQATVTSALGGKQDTLTAGTNITIDANNVISSTAQESFFRGRWATWTDVPTQADLYPEDYHGNKTPTDNDYMVVSDERDYTSPGEEIVFERIEPRQDGTYLKVIYKGYETYFPSGGAIRYLDPNNTIGAYTTGTPTAIYLKSYSAGKIIFNGVTYNENVYVLISNDIGGMNVGDKIIAYTESRNDKLGTWRFKYSGNWASVGKSGWFPEYQLEDVLPIATNTVAGIAKLYNTTGQNTDGSMTQKSITDALSAKQDNISDLATIRSGAALGATAVQPGDLATVATSGSYNDLSDKPTIPTVNNPTITITQGGVTKGSFTLNQASGDTIALDAGGGSALPDPTGHTGELLTNDGVNASWTSVIDCGTMS